MKKYLFLGLIISFLIMPVFVSAGDLKGPIVPCGTKANTTPCTFCDLFKMAQTIIDFITTGISILAILFIVIGGLMILFAGAMPSSLELGKKIITNAVIGVVIALLAWTVINMIFNTLVSEDKTKFPTPWNDIKCEGGGTTTVNKICTCGENTKIGSRDYPNEAECVKECSPYCKSITEGSKWFWCCKEKVMEKGCFSQDNRCDQRSESGYCFDDNYSCQKGVIDQISNASPELKNLIDCMKKGLPSTKAREISSITDNSGGRCFGNWNSQCSEPTDSCEGTCCGHSQNSLHYGGTKCRGTSYAVDFADESSFSYIHAAAKACMNSLWLGQVDVKMEEDHVHIELEGVATKKGCK